MMLRLLYFSVGTSGLQGVLVPFFQHDTVVVVEGVEEIGALDYDVILKLFKNNIFVIGEKKAEIMYYFIDKLLVARDGKGEISKAAVPHAAQRDTGYRLLRARRGRFGPRYH